MSTWSTSLSGYAPDDAISAVVEDCKDLVEEKGEGKIRRILHEAFASLEGHEKDAGHATAVCYTLVMLSPKALPCILKPSPSPQTHLYSISDATLGCSAASY